MVKSKLTKDNNKLSFLRDQLIIEKMKLDKFFTIFLDNADLDDDRESDDWVTYKSMLREYDRVSRLLADVQRSLV